MALFKINNINNNFKVKKLITHNNILENNIQKIFESNLEDILDIIFLASEYSTSFGGRIDTLGIDKNGSPCIIEYKKNQSDNVINQGLSYLRWLLDHKADFEILCRNKKINIKIDWDSPRVICIAESYNKFDIDTADILPINIELLRYRIYEENILYIEPENYQKIKISMSKIVKKTTYQKQKNNLIQKTYSLDDHLKKAPNNLKKIFYILREKILSIDENIREEFKKLYIAYKLEKNFVDVCVMYGSKPPFLKLFLNVKSGQLNDPKNMARDLTKPKKIGHWGNGDYEVKIKRENDIEYAFYLIKQSYNLNR